MIHIQPYADNAKKHPDKQVKMIADSIKRFGWQQPIVVDTQGIIIVGHGRYLAWQKYPEGMDEPWVTDNEGNTLSGKQGRELTLSEVKAYRLADNKLNESDWDMEMAIEDLRGIIDPDLQVLTGFDMDLLMEPDDKDDEVPAMPEEPQTKQGDVYELGSHRIMCGDSTNELDVRTLMGNMKADMVFTDPPYNVAYKGKGKNTQNGIMNDDMDAEAFEMFLADSFKNIATFTKRTAGCYIFHSHKTASTFEKALKKVGFTIDTQLIWNKPSAGMGANDYRTKHEPFFYCSQDKEKNFYGDRTGTTVWKIPKDDMRAFKWFQKEMDALERGGSTVWAMKRANVNDYVHPTQKPTELVATAITKSSKEEDIVLDPFLGSGTTLIASEKTGRTCYGMELDPKYVDVIVQRYVDYTGNTSIRKNGVDIQWDKTII